MKKIIFMEGADKLGKSTIIKEFKESLGLCYTSQTIVHPHKFKQEIKHTKNMSSLNRVLYGALDNFDIISKLESTNQEITIQDRSFLSTLVYGKMLGVSETFLDELLKEFIERVKQIEADLYFVIFVGDKPIEQDSEDVYSSMKWKDINNLYASFEVVKLLDDLKLDGFQRKLLFIENVDIDTTVEMVRSVVQV